MQELIPVRSSKIGEHEVNAVLARDLHEFLGVGKDYSNWIKDRIVQYEFSLGVDFEVAVAGDLLANSGEQTGRGGHNRIEHLITLDMAKELSMVERTPKGKQARQYFIECERRALNQPAAPALDDPAALRGILLSYTEKVLELQAKVEEQKPKARFYDAFMDSNGLFGLRQASRALGMAPNALAALLKKEVRDGGWGYLFYEGDRLTPYRRYSDHGAGYFTMKMSLNARTGVSWPQTYITPKGMDHIAHRLGIVEDAA